MNSTFDHSILLTITQVANTPPSKIASIGPRPPPVNAARGDPFDFAQDACGDWLCLTKTGPEYGDWPAGCRGRPEQSRRIPLGGLYLSPLSPVPHLLRIGFDWLCSSPQPPFSGQKRVNWLCLTRLRTLRPALSCPVPLAPWAVQCSPSITNRCLLMTMTTPFV